MKHTAATRHNAPGHNLLATVTNQEQTSLLKFLLPTAFATAAVLTYILKDSVVI